MKNTYLLSNKQGYISYFKLFLQILCVNNIINQNVHLNLKSTSLKSIPLINLANTQSILNKKRHSFIQNTVFLLFLSCCYLMLLKTFVTSSSSSNFANSLSISTICSSLSSFVSCGILSNSAFSISKPFSSRYF